MQIDRHRAVRSAHSFAYPRAATAAGPQPRRFRWTISPHLRSCGVLPRPGEPQSGKTAHQYWRAAREPATRVPGGAGVWRYRPSQRDQPPDSAHTISLNPPRSPGAVPNVPQCARHSQLTAKTGFCVDPYEVCLSRSLFQACSSTAISRESTLSTPRLGRAPRGVVTTSRNGAPLQA